MIIFLILIGLVIFFCYSACKIASDSEEEIKKSKDDKFGKNR